jgi:LysR family nitrogen assimilation transcriptional regulator
VDFRQLNTFVQVAQLGSLSRAAERLRIAQPALSRQIRILEVDLQVSLFDRHGRGMTLTEAGEHLLAKAESLLRQMEDIRAEMPERGKEVRGRCCLGVPPTVGDVIAASLIQRFHARYPLVALRVVPAFSGYLLDFLHKGEVDLAIIYGASRRPGIDLAPLVEEQLYLVGPRDARLDSGTPVSLGQVARRKLILPSAQHGLRTLIEDAARKSDLRLDVPIEVDALQTLKDLVIREIGYTILPLASVRGEIEAGRLTAAPIVRPELRRALILAHHSGRPMSQAVRLFSEMLREDISIGLTSTI